MVAVSLQPLDGYPDEREHRRRWRDLARAIVADSETPTPTPTPERPATPGELVVIGSGIETAGFTTADELRILDADHVFYCVADPATKVWINSVRPDALDLYVLYDDAKRRYSTYVQMSEALLHHVRRGATVVAIFYGHPGIFVLATHRAVGIARREGHRAEMRAAVSALDTLCADLGVDPSQPGMAMYEATDLLIRRRRPDTALHLVLWQVGLIGELGYRRHGFINANLPVLLDYLEEVYGNPGQPVINYVGSRYPGIDPLVDHQTIASLRAPSAQQWVTGISTFYLPPQGAAAPDPAMLERLGLVRPDQPVGDAAPALRPVDQYGLRERRAIDDLARFDVPASYAWQPDTAPARFVLALRTDRALRERYRADPDAALASWPGLLTDGQRRMLARRDAGATQLAAKATGATAPPRQHRQLLDRLYGRRSLTHSLRRAVERRGSLGARAAADRWSRAQGFDIDWDTFPADAERLGRDQLHPWTGLYLVDERRSSLLIHARPGCHSSDRVELDGAPLRAVRFANGKLSWAVADGNPCSGYVQADVGRDGTRRFVGVMWPAGDLPGPEHRVVAVEHRSRPAVPLAALAGRYRAFSPDGVERCVAIELVGGTGAARRVAVRVDGAPSDDAAAARGDHLLLGDWRVPTSGRVDDGTAPDHLRGDYRLGVRGEGDTRLVGLTVTRDSLVIDGGSTERATWRRNTVQWDGGPVELASGRLEGVLDPITLHPMVHGTASTASGRVVALRGMVPVDPVEACAIAEHPGDGLAPWAWAHVVASMQGASEHGGRFVWHGWDRTRVNARRIRAVLAAVREDET